MRLQLSGTYTPLGGQIAVSVGQRVIASWPADASGSYNQWVDVPADVLGRYTEVSVTYNHGDVGEECGSGVRTSLSLSSAGEVRSEPADPPTPPGFASLPQALMPRTSLAWTNGGVADVARAVEIMSGLQRLSAVRLGVDMVSVDDAMASTAPAVIIAADGRGLPHLTLPVTADGQTLTVLNADGKPSNVVLTPGVRFGSLQVARDAGRTVLVATSTRDAADLDAVLRRLSADPDRWSALSGVALLQVSGQEPVVVPGDGQSQPADSSSTGTSWVTVTLVAVGIAVVAAIVATVVLRRRRRAHVGD